MPLYLRIFLIAVSVIACFYIIKKIRKSQMRIEAAISWVFFSFVILIISIFPQIVTTVSSWLGIQSPANFVYLIVLIITLGTVFSLSIKLSQLEYKISILTEEIAIAKNREMSKEKSKENEEK